MGEHQLVCGSDFHPHRHPCVTLTLEVPHHGDHDVDADDHYLHSSKNVGEKKLRSLFFGLKNFAEKVRKY